MALRSPPPPPCPPPCPSPTPCPPPNPREPPPHIPIPTSSMEGGCCDQLEKQSRDELNNKAPIDSSTSRQDEEPSTAKDVKKSLAFGIEAILATAKHSDDQKETKNIVKEEKFEVKEDIEEEDSSRLSHHPINFPFSYSNYYPLTSSSSSSSWSDEKRSGSTSPPLQEMRRPFLSSSSSCLSLSSTSSSSLSSTVSEEEKLTRPMLPFLLPHTLSLRRHRIDR